MNLRVCIVGCVLCLPDPEHDSSFRIFRTSQSAREVTVGGGDPLLTQPSEPGEPGA